MREILFRGKRIDNGEWVEGYLVKKGGETLIARYPYRTGKVHETSWLEFCFGGFIEVIPETVGQYTGLTDKDDRKIFEGDIIKICGQHSCFDKVEFLDGLAGFYAVNDDIHIPAELATLKKNFIEVIGNIYDNPELLEAK